MFLLTVPRRCFFCGPFLLFCLVFVMLSYLLFAALWSPSGKGLPLGSLVCDVLLWFVTFPCGVLGQAWYLIASISDLCPLTNFVFYVVLSHLFVSKRFLVNNIICCVTYYIYISENNNLSYRLSHPPVR